VSRKSAGIASLVVLLALASPALAEATHPDVRDVRALSYFARRSGRLWDHVEKRIEEAEKRHSESEAVRSDLLLAHHDLLVDWGAAQESSGVQDAVSLALEKYERAMNLGLPPQRSAPARGRYVTLRLSEAERLLEDSPEDAEVHIAAVLAVRGLEPAGRTRARDLRFRIKRRRYDRLRSEGDLDQAFEELEELVRGAEGMTLPAVEELRRELDRLRRTTGVIRVTTVPLGSTFDGVRESIAGRLLPLPKEILVHRFGPDHRLEEEVAARTSAWRDGSARLRLELPRKSADVQLHVDFPGEARPPLLVPVRLERKGTVEVALPDRVPARMAFVPQSPEMGAFFIGLYEVPLGVMNEWLVSRGKRKLGGDPSQPAQRFAARELAEFLTWAGVSLPTVAEWRLAARGKDGRPLPWGLPEGDITAQANINRKSIAYEAVEGTTGRGISPYGLVHVLGNVWELVEGGVYAMGGTCTTTFPFRLYYRRPGSMEKQYHPVDLFEVARPLYRKDPRSGAKIPQEQQEMWSEYLSGPSGPQRPGIGLRVVVRVKNG
jgi:hypothetical protein